MSSVEINNEIIGLANISSKINGGEIDKLVNYNTKKDEVMSLLAKELFISKLKEQLNIMFDKQYNNFDPSSPFSRSSHILGRFKPKIVTVNKPIWDELYKDFIINNIINYIILPFTGRGKDEINCSIKDLKITGDIKSGDIIYKFLLKDPAVSGPEYDINLKEIGKFPNEFKKEAIKGGIKGGIQGGIKIEIIIKKI